MSEIGMTPEINVDVYNGAIDGVIKELAYLHREDAEKALEGSE